MTPVETTIGIFGHIVLAIMLIGVASMKPTDRINNTSLLVLCVAIFSLVYFWVKVLT